MSGSRERAGRSAVRPASGASSPRPASARRVDRPAPARSAAVPSWYADEAPTPRAGRSGRLGREAYRYDGLRDEVRRADEAPRSRGGARGDEVEGVEEGRRADEGGSGLLGRITKARRSASKAKADREFTRRYGDDRPSAAEAGPRAAVYETQMGRQHKRAARLQNDGTARRGSSAPSRPSDKREAGSGRSRLVTLGAVAVCLLMTVVFLYPPAQQYYQEVRERDRLQAEYEAIQQRNDAIQRQVDYLSGDAGVEDKARREFGWVLEGEQSVSVSGIDVEDDSTFTANIVAGEVPAPDTWYSFLDPLFGVD